MNKKKAETRRLAIKRSRESKRREQMRKRRRKEKELEDGSEGWGIDILGFLWPEKNSEKKKSMKRRLEVEERADIASDRIATFVSDDETYEFFGFNTTYLDKG